MTLATKYPRRMTLPSAALAALLLAGCSSGHVGESWQCPLADAGTCDSVADADPAVPDMKAARNTVFREPLWRVRGEQTRTMPRKADSACEADCAGFDPFGWLARLLGGETAAEKKTAGTGPTRLLPPEAPTPDALPAESVTAEPLPASPGPANDDAGGVDLRTDEVVARIWIAPFVDAGGVYREASYVRVVLEPAGWKLGR